MKERINKLLFIIISIISLFLCVDFVFANIYYYPTSNYTYNPYYPGFNPNPNPYYPGFNPNPNPYYPGFNPNPNPYYPNYYPYYPYPSGYGTGTFMIPYDAYYYMVGYDRQAYVYANGEVMESRVPVLAGNYQYPTDIANRLIYSSYVSISNWCNDNIMTKEGVQDYYLNNARVERVSPTEVVLLVDCALKKKGVISGYEQFRVTLYIQAGRFVWRNIGTNGNWLYGDGRVYEFDSNSGSIVIIR